MQHEPTKEAPKQAQPEHVKHPQHAEEPVPHVPKEAPKTSKQVPHETGAPQKERDAVRDSPPPKPVPKAAAVPAPKPSARATPAIRPSPTKRYTVESVAASAVAREPHHYYHYGQATVGEVTPPPRETQRSAPPSPAAALFPPDNSEQESRTSLPDSPAKPAPREAPATLARVDPLIPRSKEAPAPRGLISPPRRTVPEGRRSASPHQSPMRDESGRWISPIVAVEEALRRHHLEEFAALKVPQVVDRRSFSPNVRNKAALMRNNGVVLGKPQKSLVNMSMPDAHFTRHSYIPKPSSSDYIPQELRRSGSVQSNRSSPATRAPSPVSVYYGPSIDAGGVADIRNKSPSVWARAPPRRTLFDFEPEPANVIRAIPCGAEAAKRQSEVAKRLSQPRRLKLRSQAAAMALMAPMPD